MSSIYKAIQINPSDTINKISIDVTSIENHLNSSLIYRDFMTYLEDYDYKLTIYCRDLEDDLPDTPNNIATILAKKKAYNGKMIMGPAILINNHGDITKSEFNKILNFAKNFDYEKY